MTVEIIRRGMIRPITDLPATADATTGFMEVQQGSAFYSIPAGSVGGGDPALAPLGTEEASYTSEFTSAPSGWDWLNQGTSTVTYALSRAILNPQKGGAGTNNLRLFGPPTFPVAPFAVRVRFLNWANVVGAGGALAVFRTTNSRIHTVNAYVRTAMTSQAVSEVWAVNDWSNYSTINATRYGPTNNDERGRDRFLQVRCDGTSIYFDYSVDNARYKNITSTTLATYLGGTGTDLRVMMIGNNPTATDDETMGYDWFRTYGNSSLNQ